MMGSNTRHLLHVFPGFAVGGAQMRFATLAARKLPKGSADWERANDIIAVAGPQAKQQREE